MTTLNKVDESTSISLGTVIHIGISLVAICSFFFLLKGEVTAQGDTIKRQADALTIVQSRSIETNDNILELRGEVKNLGMLLFEKRVLRAPIVYTKPKAQQSEEVAAVNNDSADYAPVKHHNPVLSVLKAPVTLVKQLVKKPVEVASDQP